jgi:hypothetical protein
MATSLSVAGPICYCKLSRDCVLGRNAQSRQNLHKGRTHSYVKPLPSGHEGGLCIC